MKNNELLKSMPVSQPVSAESLLITTTKSNGKYKQKFQHLIQNHKTHNLDIRYVLDIENILKSYIIARYYGWEPKEEDLEEIISHTSYFDINVDDAIYEVLTMPKEKITI